jgi:archaemetzincin
MGRKILLRPLTEVDSRILETIKQGLEKAFACPVEIKAQIEDISFAYDATKKQYIAPALIGVLLSDKMEAGSKSLGVVDVDLYSPGLNFVFGQADIEVGVAIVSLYRLRQERYDLPPDEQLVKDRAIKEAVHEVGHTYSLSHCPNPHCVMHFSNSLADTDIKEASFCSKCQKKLARAEANT